MGSGGLVRAHSPFSFATASKATGSLLTEKRLRAMMGVLEANMTVANVFEIAVVLAILYVAYLFYQKRG